MSPRATRNGERVQVPPSEHSGVDLRGLLLLADGRYGVEQRIRALLVELAVEAPDWPTVVEWFLYPGAYEDRLVCLTSYLFEEV